MKMISDGGRIINIRGVKFSRSEDYPRKTYPPRNFVPLRYVRSATVPFKGSGGRVTIELKYIYSLLFSFRLVTPMDTHPQAVG